MYQPLNETTVIAYVKRSPAMGKVFAAGDALQAKDLADGNVNLVFRVYSEDDPIKKSVIVKQALPWARAVGESFPMPLDRARIESRMLEIEARYCPDQVPTLYHYDEEMHLVIMEDLNQHIIMRKGLMQQVRYPYFAQHIGTFMARTLFYTSDLYMDPKEKKALVAEMMNPHLCKVTEDLVFTHPYMEHPGNRWNRLLDPQVEAIRANDALKSEIHLLKEAFMTRAEALIHGDLHTGSIMLNEEVTKVIDPEFGFYGPMGFDIGAVLGNLALSYASQEYHAQDPEERKAYRQWILDTIRDTWKIFEAEFRALWEEHGQEWPSPAFREKYMRRLLQDTAGFGGTKMMRRMLGLAHVPDMDSIPDDEARAVTESMALNIGQSWILNRHRITAIDELVELVATGKSSYPFK